MTGGLLTDAEQLRAFAPTCTPEELFSIASSSFHGSEDTAVLDTLLELLPARFVDDLEAVALNVEFRDKARATLAVALLARRASHRGAAGEIARIGKLLGPRATGPMRAFLRWEEAAGRSPSRGSGRSKRRCSTTHWSPRFRTDRSRVCRSLRNRSRWRASASPSRRAARCTCCRGRMARSCRRSRSGRTRRRSSARGDRPW